MKSNVRNYTTKEILTYVKSLPSFKGIPHGYWIAGFQSNKNAPNKFDDKFYLFNHELFIKVLSGTTHAGLPVLQGGFLKYNKKGTAVIKTNEWYYDVWTYGLHHGKMPALKQVGTFLGYRDGDRDSIPEEIGVLEKFNWTGINFHTVSYELDMKKVGENIGEWSAGCQVANNVEQYLMVINMIKHQHRITYCLVKEF